MYAPRRNLSEASGSAWFRRRVNRTGAPPPWRGISIASSLASDVQSLRSVAACFFAALTATYIARKANRQVPVARQRGTPMHVDWMHRFNALENSRFAWRDIGAGAAAGLDYPLVQHGQAGNGQASHAGCRLSALRYTDEAMHRLHIWQCRAWSGAYPLAAALAALQRRHARYRFKHANAAHAAAGPTSAD